MVDRVVPIIQCNFVDFEGATDVSLRRAPDGRYVIEHVIEKAKTIGTHFAKPVIACPDLSENRIFGELANRYEVDVYYGDKINLVSRLSRAASISEADNVAWLQGLLYFLDTQLMERFIQWALKRQFDFARFVDGTCKHWLGQFFRVGALQKVQDSLESLELEQRRHFLARPFSYMRSKPNEFSIGLYEELPRYSTDRLIEMRQAAAKIHLGGERATHTVHASQVGDVSIGRYKEILSQITPGGVGLDIACGFGFGAKLISDERHCHMIGVDLSEDVLSDAKKKLGNEIDFRTGNAEAIPVEDQTCDFAVSIATVEHVVDDMKFIQELWRILKPGGKVIVYTPQNQLGEIPTWPWHEREYSVEQLVKLISTEFTVTDIWGWQNGAITREDPRGDGVYVMATK